MKIEITHKFQKQVDNYKEQRIKLKVISIIQSVIAAENMSGFTNLKKLTGYKKSYRIRLGNYRIGIVIDGGTVIFAAFDHRSEIYNYFP